MIRIFLLKCLLCISIMSVSGQQALRMRPADQIMVDLFSDYWVNLPDYINAKTINRGINISLLRDIPLGTSNFSIAIGMGFTGHNLYSDHLYTFDDNGFGFFPIATDYSSNKISLNYLNAPLEIRFRSGPRNRAFKAYTGVAAGYMINAHTRYAGIDPYTGINTRIKTAALRNIHPFMLSLQIRMAWGRIGMFGRYGLLKVFELPEGETMRPVSLGLMISLQ